MSAVLSLSTSKGVHLRFLRCSVLQCVAVCCNVVLCDAVWFSASVGLFLSTSKGAFEVYMLQCVAVCCTVLYCVALCCSLLQFVAVHYSAFVTGMHACMHL